MAQTYRRRFSLRPFRLQTMGDEIHRSSCNNPYGREHIGSEGTKVGSDDTEIGDDETGFGND
jgi:hypothetical protein